MSNKSEIPFISVIVPALNEEDYIATCLGSLIPQVPYGAGEILVVDGGSTDRTRAIVEQICQGAANVKLIHNPQRIQAAAVNVGAQHANKLAEFLVRADAHSRYPENFIRSIVDAFRSTSADSIVVPMRTVGNESFQKAVAAIQNSFLGNGGALHRSRTESRYVDHGHHAGFTRAAFSNLGGYDVGFSPNEDAEYDLRLIRSGGRIWMCCSAEIEYFPRKNAIELARQYFGFGRGRLQSALLHGQPLRFRQIAPIGALFCNASALMLGLWFPVALTLPGAYLLLCIGWSGYLAWRLRDRHVWAGWIAAVVMHHAWGLGALQEIGVNFCSCGFGLFSARKSPARVAK